jgi:hypothetical protein
MIINKLLNRKSNAGIAEFCTRKFSLMSAKRSNSETATGRNATMLPLLRGMFICPEILKSNGGDRHERLLNDLPDPQVIGTTATRLHEILHNRRSDKKSPGMIAEHMVI